MKRIIVLLLVLCICSLSYSQLPDALKWDKYLQHRVSHNYSAIQFVTTDLFIRNMLIPPLCVSREGDTLSGAKGGGEYVWIIYRISTE